ncbi:HAMP domain-containing protein [Geothermobacter hydrogeniphilus]|uniref:histidine kinase n=1 Tax=Geothermobacter hydrogeniphilus TaxID=1969733 RepID=A0A1X0YE29_9BACT|nr:HAMP domain-containing protein [Geothermobacter hydrogeniphilus]ORJ63369.1 hypothetical protein B5V00_00455 [Geothermobacter hydrogeniphilus]
MLVSIRSRMIASHFGMMLLAMLILGPSSYMLMKYYLQQQRSADLQFIARHVAGMLDQRLLDSGQRLRQIAEGRVVREFPETARLAAAGEYFSRFRQRFPVIAYLDENGWEEVKVVEGKRLPYLEDQSSNPLFKLARKHPNRALLGPLAPAPENGQPMLTLIYGIQRYFGDEFVGALLARMPLSELTRILDDIEVGKSGYLVLIENSGRILAYPDPQRIMQQLPKSALREKAVRSALNGDVGGLEGTVLGVHGLVAYAPLRQLDASLIVVLPYGEFIAGPVEVRNTIFLILLGISLLGVLVAILLANRLTRPILDLTAAALRISHGDFSARLKDDGEGEISALVKAFNRMVRELRNSTVSRQYFDRIVEHMQQGLLLVGLDGKVHNVNRAACRLFGMEADDLLGVPLEQLIAEPGADRTDWLQTLLSNPGVRESEKVLLTPDGRVRVRLSWTVLEDGSGTVREIACLFSPVADQPAKGNS